MSATFGVVSMDQEHALKDLYRNIGVGNSTYNVERRSVQALEQY